VLRGSVGVFLGGGSGRFVKGLAGFMSTVKCPKATVDKQHKCEGGKGAWKGVAAESSIHAWYLQQQGKEEDEEKRAAYCRSGRDWCRYLAAHAVGHISNEAVPVGNCQIRVGMRERRVWARAEKGR
jgi:hypothetical protein